jgi:diguanylate cyclase (GGDEF)-like protein
MNLLSWFDNRTLLTCLFLLAVVFALQFISLRRAYPTFRGIGSVALSLLLGAPGLTLFYLHGLVPNLISATLAGLLVISSFVLFYRGLMQFLGDLGRPTLLIVVSTALFFVLCFLVHVRHNVFAGLAVVALAAVFARGLTAILIFKHAEGRRYMRLFGLMMTLSCLISVWRTYVFTVLCNKTPALHIQRTIPDSLPLASNVLYVSLAGLFFLSMINDRVLAIVRNESERDPLTEALNRRGIEHRLTTEIKRIERHRDHLTVALIDVDHLKTINDTSGHAAGDAVLRHIAATISIHLRAYASLGRVGGDEFLLILPQTSSSEAAPLIERITQATKSPYRPGRNQPVTLSIGLTEAVPSESTATILARADKALYAAKDAGRNCARLLLPDSQEEIVPLDPLPLVS